MKITPMRLLRIPEPFDHPEFIFEPKIDGFRALAIVDGHGCRLMSRNGHPFKSWPQLAEEMAHAVRAARVVLDGEICCLDTDGRSNFKNLLFRREWPYFYAFDILSLERRDLTRRPLLERKRMLADVLPTIDCRVLYLDHIEQRGGGSVSRGMRTRPRRNRCEVDRRHVPHGRPLDVLDEDQEPGLHADPRPARAVRGTSSFSPAEAPIACVGSRVN